MEYLTEDDIKEICIHYGCFPNQPPIHPFVQNKCQKLLNHFNKMIDKLIELESRIQKKYPDFDMSQSLEFNINQIPASFTFDPNVEMLVEDKSSYRKEILAIFEKYTPEKKLNYVVH